jgi:hypothetical protein
MALALGKVLVVGIACQGRFMPMNERRRLAAETRAIIEGTKHAAAEMKQCVAESRALIAQSRSILMRCTAQPNQAPENQTRPLRNSN